MAQESDRIARDIASTRSDLVRDVDALADRTMPNRVVRRRWNDVKHKVMGAPRSTAARQAEQVGGQVAEAVREAPHMVAERTQGNPVAVGLIAFGAGLLAASLVPTTDMERGIGQQLKESGPDLIEPIREPLAESGHRLTEDLSDSVSQAAHEVKQTAQPTTDRT